LDSCLPPPPFQNKYTDPSVLRSAFGPRPSPPPLAAVVGGSPFLVPVPDIHLSHLQRQQQFPKHPNNLGWDAAQSINPSLNVENRLLHILHALLCVIIRWELLVSVSSSPNLINLLPMLYYPLHFSGMGLRSRLPLLLILSFFCSGLFADQTRVKRQGSTVLTKAWNEALPGVSFSVVARYHVA